MTSAVIPIPIYKSDFSELEKASLFQCCKILNKYNFSLVCPDGLDIKNYEIVLKDFNVNYKVDRFDRKFFKSVESYNNLMLDVNFYKRYEKYEFALIYQLDAYVFRDDLMYWCKKDFDYIGAPWFENFGLSDDKSKLLEVAGNGGFSLRKISSFIKVLSYKKEVANFIGNYLKDGQYEDVFFSQFAKNIDKNFKVAPPSEAMYFSFESQPKRLHEMINKKIPFGCHAWERYDFDFWEYFVDFSNVDFGNLNRENLKKISILRANLDYEKGRFKSLNKDLIDTRKRIERTYNSREWKIVLKLQKLFKFFFRR
ncbi:MAG: hypothetical protein ACD_7C00582G0006 [uncultured bacterium]|nr:MAG: hypothetical protein ACD_7C00582G0006 [uncultured bacterium]OFY32106.1 MAG: hypothetical protein A2X09_15380 [Bacteroidetes bacterium GWF2_43_11]HBR79243.1 hypothetical protein [Candidatus Moranbacteria bacterium]HCU01352.1 hypothetical protein [Candidatus Nomurabacteria bacterium]